MASPLVRGQAICAVALGLAAATPALGEGQSSDALEQAEHSVVRIVTYAVDDSGARTPYMTGSGFVVAPGKVLTNRHVAALPPNATQEAVYVIPDSKVGGVAILASQNTLSDEADLALLDVPELNAPVMTISLREPTKDATVRALGYPGITDMERNLSQDQMLQEPAEPYVTPGSIALFSSVDSGNGRQVASIFHTAPINPGNSGGPLIDACGRAVGINTWQGAAHVGEGGEIEVPQGQFIAQSSSVLASFLRAESVPTLTVDAPCTPPEQQALQDRLLTDESAITAAKDQFAKTEADLAARVKTDEKAQRSMLIGGSIAGFFLIALIFWRGRRAHAHAGAPAPAAAPAAPQIASPTVETAAQVVAATPKAPGG